MAEQQFEFIAGTQDTPPQIRNEHLGTEEQIAEATTAVAAWYADLAAKQNPNQEGA